MKISKSQLRRIILEEVKREIANEGIMDFAKGMFDPEARKWAIKGAGWRELNQTALDCYEQARKQLFNANAIPEGKCSATVQVPLLSEFRHANVLGDDADYYGDLMRDASIQDLVFAIRMWANSKKGQRQFVKATVNEMLGFTPEKSPNERKAEAGAFINTLNKIATGKA